MLRIDWVRAGIAVCALLIAAPASAQVQGQMSSSFGLNGSLMRGRNVTSTPILVTDASSIGTLVCESYTYTTYYPGGYMPPAAFTSAQIVDPNGVQLAYDAEGGELDAYTWVSAELDEGAPIGVYTCNTYGLIDLPGCCTWEESQAPTVYNGVDCAEPDAQMKSVIRNEYRTRGLTIPECSVLRADYSSAYFSMGELNRNGYHTRAWIQDVLLIELDHIRTDFGRALTLSNGYRCPDKNAAVGGVSNSQHQFGRAADIIPVGEALTMDWWNQVATIARNHGADVPNEFDHVHVEWD